MSKLHLVFGGRVRDPQGLDFDLETIDLDALVVGKVDAGDTCHWATPAAAYASD